MTDSDTIARLGRQLGARYIVAGSITRLGGQQLLVIAIMQIENLQQIAGEWLTFQSISEVRSKLPEIAKNIVAASQKNTSRLQKLAVLPFQMSSGDREADALAQILAIEIIRTGAYAVFPRTKTLEQVQAEYNNQSSGGTDDYSVVAIGRGDNPLLALSGAARRLDQDRMFNAAIINVESGAQVKGDSVEYQAIEDSIEAIQTLAKKLTGDVLRLAFLKSVDDINKAGAGSYTITLTGDVTIGPNDKDIRFTANAQKTITIQGDSAERSLTSQRNTALLEVPSGITLVLGRNLRLSSVGSGVDVSTGGTLRMENGATIANCGGGFGGVYVSDGTFTMSGGTISGNKNSGVFLSGNSTFTMSGGTISRNNDSGVKLMDFKGNPTFTMTGGTISGNTANFGGGVNVDKNSVFVKTDGTIAGDNRSTEGSGHMVYLSMKLDDKNMSHIDSIIAVQSYPNNVRNTAAGPSVNLDSRRLGSAGGWEPRR